MSHLSHFVCALPPTLSLYRHQVALGEDALASRLLSLQGRLAAGVSVQVSAQRTMGAFYMTNIDEVGR